MALDTRISHAAANAAADALCALANSGFLKIYAGSKPADANTAISGQTLLATHNLSATAFAGAVNGVATANAVANATIAADGTASFFRIFKSNGTSVVFDGTVGTSGCNANVNSVAFANGATSAISALTYTAVENGS